MVGTVTVSVAVCVSSGNPIAGSPCWHQPWWMLHDCVARFPVFIYHTPNGFDVYGMPSHVNSYYKIGIDSGGNSVLPGTRSYVPDPVREKYCMEFAKQFNPKVTIIKSHVSDCRRFTQTRPA